MISARRDYQSEIGWPDYVRQVERLAGAADVIVTSNYGEAGALELFGHALPPVASVDVTMRYWRPARTGRYALLVGLLARRRRLLHGRPAHRAHRHPARQRRARRTECAMHTRRPAPACLASDRRDL